MNKYERLMEAIAIVVADTMPWQEKRDAVKVEAKSFEEWDGALEEFLSWFESEES